MSLQRLELHAEVDVEGEPEFDHPDMDARIKPRELHLRYLRTVTPHGPSYRLTVTVRGPWMTKRHGWSRALCEVAWIPRDHVEMPKWVMGYLLGQKPAWFTEAIKPLFTLEGEELHPDEDEIFEEEL